MKHSVALTYSKARTHVALTVGGASVFASPHPHWQEVMVLVPPWYIHEQ